MSEVTKTAADYARDNFPEAAELRQAMDDAFVALNESCGEYTHAADLKINALRCAYQSARAAWLERVKEIGQRRLVVAGLATDADFAAK